MPSWTSAASNWVRTCNRWGWFVVIVQDQVNRFAESPDAIMEEINVSIDETTLRRIAETQGNAFYRGELAEVHVNVQPVISSTRAQIRALVDSSL